LHDGEGGQQLEELEDDAQFPPAPFGNFTFAQGVNGRSVHPHLARRRPINARNHVDQRGFAAARFADNRHEFARSHRQVDALERGEIAGAAVVGLDDLTQVDERVWRGSGVETAVCRWRFSKFGEHIGRFR
jgi:hypothetical protein